MCLKDIAFLLLISMYWWSGLPLFWSPVDFAAHFIEYEGEHCRAISILHHSLSGVRLDSRLRALTLLILVSLMVSTALCGVEAHV